MKICVAQTKPYPGQVEANIKKHVHFVAQAVSLGAEFIMFPELSITGYEPNLAAQLATSAEDGRLQVFQYISDERNISICLGFPQQTPKGTQIAMAVFQPGITVSSYAKQWLHEDELPYFVPGDQPFILELGKQRIAAAICFESLRAGHHAQAIAGRATIYAASVAKSAKGTDAAFDVLPAMGRRNKMMVVMANAVGPCDNFIAAGRTAIWNEEGILEGQLDEIHEGFLAYDTDTGRMDMEIFAD